MIRVKTNSKDAEQILMAIAGTTRSMQGKLEAQSDEVGQAAVSFLRKHLEANLSPFMASRTKIESDAVGGAIRIVISGMTEGEAEDAGAPTPKGGTPNPKSNLWERIENGASNDEAPMGTYEKDVGGVKVNRKKRAASVSTGKKGEVRKAVSSVTAQLGDFLAALIAEAGTNMAVSSIETASRGKVKITKSAMTALGRQGITRAYVESMKTIAQVSVTPRGQIIARGSKGQFVSIKGSGIPTSVRTS